MAASNPYLASASDAGGLDPTRTRRLLAEAKRAYDFAAWISGDPSIGSSLPIGYVAAATNAPRTSTPTSIDDAVDQPAPANWPPASWPTQFPWVTPHIPLGRYQPNLSPPSGALLTGGDVGVGNSPYATPIRQQVPNSDLSELAGHPVYPPPLFTAPAVPSPPIAAMVDAGLWQPAASPIAPQPPIADDRSSGPSARLAWSAPPRSQYWQAQHGIDTGPVPMDRAKALARTENTRRLASEGWDAGYGEQPIIPYEWKRTYNSTAQAANTLWNAGTVLPWTADKVARTARGAYLGAIGGLAGMAGDSGAASHPDELAQALPEMINIIGAATAQPELNMLPRFPVSTALRFASRYPGESVAGVAEPYLLYRRPAAPTDADLAALEARAQEIHTVLEPRAQRHRTTAVLSTNDKTIVGGGAKVDLEQKQLDLLRDDEVPAELPGAHAETTVLWKAFARGYTPRALATSRPICPECRPWIEAFGGKVISPTLAIFPRR
jgi:hypothetical protein